MWIILCIFYATVVAVNSIFHTASYFLAPPLNYVNVAGVSAITWRTANINFTIFYLFFPILCLVQYLLLRDQDANILVFFFGAIIVISLAVLFYQFYVNNGLLNQSYWKWLHRAGGLSTDPNAYAMTAFLLLPLCLFGTLFCRKRIAQAFYLIVIISLIMGMVFSGNRTVLGGTLLLFASYPLILSMTYRRWPWYLRLILSLSPLIIIGGVYILMPTIVQLLEQMNTKFFARRLITAWHIFSDGGLEGLLFRAGHRGPMLLLGLVLLIKAPLAGWGPGGFYREYPNEVYIQFGEIQHAYDSVLNHYLMIAGDLGLPALILNLVLIVSPLIITALALRNILDIRRRFILSTLFVSNFIFLIMIAFIPPSYFPGLLWLWTAQLAYLVLEGERNGILFKIGSRACRSAFLFFSCIALLLSASGSFQTTFGLKSYSVREKKEGWLLRSGENCYTVKKSEKGKVLWLGKNTLLRIPITKALPEKVRLAFYVRQPDIGFQPAVVRFGGKDGVANELIVRDISGKTIEIPITPEYIIEFSPLKKPAKKYFVVSLDLSLASAQEKRDRNKDQRNIDLGLLIPDL